jgi:hypothetical protein
MTLGKMGQLGRSLFFPEELDDQGSGWSDLEREVGGGEVVFLCCVAHWVVAKRTVEAV